MSSNARTSGSQGSDWVGLDSTDKDSSARAASIEDEPHIGAYLAAQRRLRGISREELCHLTRIPMRSLERLEDGAFDLQDDGFVRGFVRTVAVALGLDAHDTLARMTREPLAWETGAGFGASGVVRSLVLLLALIGLLGSVGLVSMALRPNAAPEGSALVQRRDPVRVLAEGLGGRTELEAEIQPMMSTRRTEEVAEVISPPIENAGAEVLATEAPVSDGPRLEAAAPAP